MNRPRKPRGVDPARRAAYDVLRALRADDAYANLVLPHALRSHGLTGRDAAFATELASGTIRRRGTYDAILAACIDRPLAKVESRVLDALRLGAHQLLAMRVPDHAAISTTVDLIRQLAGPRAGGFGNAVLRRVASHPLEEWVRRVAPADRIGHAAVAHSHPEWIVRALAEALGDREAELEELLAADNEPPRVTLVARPGRAERAELPGEPTPYSPFGTVLPGGDPAAVRPVAEGRAGVQDEGSQLVAIAASEAPVDVPDLRWLDPCAGPGGKAALLAGLAAGRGALLHAAEIQPHRADLVRSALDGADGVAEVLVADARRPPWPRDHFDRVLLDAPCSGLGALRRRPEARWRKRPEGLDELTALQRDLLHAALDSARLGGAVTYATCSPVLAETRGVVEAVLAERTDAALEPVPLAVPDSAGPLPGTVQLWPHRHQTDAMFVALLRRI